MNNPMLLIVGKVTSDLTDTEFAILYRAIMLKMSSIKRVMGYEKAASLFTEEDGTKMERATWEAFQALFHERFPKS